MTWQPGQYHLADAIDELKTPQKLNQAMSCIPCAMQRPTGEGIVMMSDQASSGTALPFLLIV